MKLYENVVIGNFLYGLGFALGAQLKSGQLPSMVNLLQQTPDDKRLGDVLMAFPGTVRLIEFKTEANKSTKEQNRHAFLRQVLSQRLEQLPSLPDVSRRVHWYIETAPVPEAALKARIEPYLDALGEGHRLRPKTPERFQDFIQELAQGILQGVTAQVSQNERDYLDLVRLAQGPEDIGTAGLVLIAGSGGGLHFAALRDLMELNLPHGQWIEYNKNFDRSIELQRQMPELERKGPVHKLSKKGMEL